MGRIYTFVAEGLALADNVSGDLLVLQAADNRPFQVVRSQVTQREQELAQQTRFRLVRRGGANGTPGAGTVTVAMHQKSDALTAAVASCNHTAMAPSLGAEVGVLDATSESLPNGYVYLPPLELRVFFCGVGDFFAINLPAPHGITGQVITFDVTVAIEEFD